MKTTFIATNGVEVEGVVLYTSSVFNFYTYQVYDEIVYAQNRLIRLRHISKFDNKGNYIELKPEIEIINSYVVIPELD